VARLGINAAGSDRADRFDDGEQWTFDWNIDTFFQGVNLGDFSTATETFSIQSDDWIDLSISPGSSEITFDATTGKLMFAAGDSSDDFTLDDLTGGSLLPVSAGTDIAISFSDTGGQNASLQSITVANPEPGTLVLGSLAATVLLAFRSRRRKRREAGIQ
jgi:hypothetical protein